MKKILLATDFSAPAKNAEQFAAELCRETGASLILFHTYRIQIPVGEGGMVTWTLADTEHDVKDLLEKEVKMLREKYDIDASYRFTPGFAHEEIDAMQQELKADLVIMGIAHGSALSDYLLGSTTLSFIRHAHAPVLVIPAGVSYMRPRRILFACDYDSRNTPGVLSPLKDLAAVFNSRVFILNVVRSGEGFSVRKSIEGIHIDEYLEPVNHIYYFPEDENVVAGLDHFVNTHDVGWVVIIPHQHTWYERLFNIPTTKKYLFHANRPVLVLPDQLRFGN